jgi:transcriptional regulator with XRE-family HTH domain
MVTRGRRRAGGRPPVLDPRLANLLRQARLESWMSGENAAGKLGWSPSKVSRIERGRTPVHLDDLQALLEVYQVGAEMRLEVIRLAEHAAEGPRTIGDVASSHREQCDEAYVWAPSVIPPPLRTPGYAQAVAASLQQVQGTLPSDVVFAATIAEQWADRVSERRDPLQLHAVLDAAVLRRRVGSKAVMAGQLTYLIQLTSRANVHLRVIPFDAAIPAGVAAFSLLRFRPYAASALPDVVFDDNDADLEPRLVAEEPDTWRAWRAYTELERASEDPAKALAAATARA